MKIFSIKNTRFYIFAVIAIIIIAPSLIFSIVDALKEQAWRSSPEYTRQSVQNAYDEISAKEDKYFDHQKKELRSSRAVTNGFGQTKVSVCYVGGIYASSDFPTSYGQSCFLRYTAVFTTDLDKISAYNKFLTSARATSINPNSDISNTCILATEWGGASFRYTAAGSKPSSIDRYNEIDYEKCGAPLRDLGNNSFTKGKVRKERGDSYSTRVFEDNIDRKILSSQNQIWLEYEINYYDQDLGCAHHITPYFFLMCDRPRDSAVQ